MNAPFRPALRYLGGKWKLAERIIRYFPAHRIYVEPFGGAASVLLQKPKSYAEIYNDLDGDVVNLFRVLRDREGAAELVRLLRLTPFSRDEFEASYELTQDPVERARRLVVRSFMGHGSNAPNIERTTGFRANATRNGTTPARDWANFPPALVAVAARIQLDGATVENRPAVDVIRRFDGPETLIYADPPYVHETRSGKTVGGALYNAYAVEMTDDQHVELLEVLCGCRGMVVLSGYPHPLYDERLADWGRVEIDAMADGARPRTEVLWINPAAKSAFGLFGVGANRIGGDA